MANYKPKRKYKKLTQQMILQRIREGTLLVCFNTLTIYSKLCGRKELSLWKEITHWKVYRGGRKKEYPNIKLRWKGCQVTIPLHRLAWIAYNMQEIPDGCEIDHYPDKNLENWHYSNLVLRTPEEHRARHASEEGDLPT